MSFFTHNVSNEIIVENTHCVFKVFWRLKLFYIYLHFAEVLIVSNVNHIYFHDIREITRLFFW